MQTDKKKFELEGDPVPEEAIEGEEQSTRKLVRLVKPINYRETRGGKIDQRVIASKYFNCFSFPRTSGTQPHLDVALGIGSPNRGDGKTLVATNLAVSMALADQRETVLVDMNLQSPRVHKVFGLEQAPGLVESLRDSTVHICHTGIERLSVVTSGLADGVALGTGVIRASSGRGVNENTSFQFGMETVTGLRDVLHSLKQEFEMIVVDLPALADPIVAPLITNVLDGLIIVVNAHKTKKEEIDMVLRKVHPDRLIGFVYNRAKPRDLQNLE